MALSTLKYEGNRKKNQGSLPAWNSGEKAQPGALLVYSGEPTEYYNWEFRAKARIAGTKKEERPLVTARLVEGLQGDAFQVARDIGLSKLEGESGFELLCSRLRSVIFPLQKQEAKELLRLGQMSGSILSRQSGEPMSSYISRRKRWWQTLKELDDSIDMSTTLLGDLMLEHSNLSRIERLLVLTSTCNSTELVDVEAALIEQHGRIHTDQEADEESQFEDADWYEDEVEEAQLEALVGLLDDGFEDPDDLEDLAQVECTAYLARVQRKGKGKGKGKGKPAKGKGKGSSLTLEDRRAKLRQLKEKSTCKVCFRKGHWAGDPQCSGKKSALAQRTPPASPVKENAAHIAFKIEEDDPLTKYAHVATTATEVPVLEEDEEVEEEMLPPDESPVINFGQYRGFTYRQVVKAYPEYVDWATTQQRPGEALSF